MEQLEAVRKDTTHIVHTSNTAETLFFLAFKLQTGEDLLIDPNELTPLRELAESKVCRNTP